MAGRPVLHQTAAGEQGTLGGRGGHQPVMRLAAEGGQFYEIHPAGTGFQRKTAQVGGNPVEQMPPRIDVYTEVTARGARPDQPSVQIQNGEVAVQIAVYSVDIDADVAGCDRNSLDSASRAFVAWGVEAQPASTADRRRARQAERIMGRE